MHAPTTLTNAWKRRGVFTCSHTAHEDFQGSVSPYHVLVEKRCYPQGCLYFRWRCLRLEKGGKCPRKYSQVGRLCRGCREYEEEKVHQQPRLLLSPGQWRAFRAHLEEFEGWLDRNLGRDLEVTARIHEVKPSFVREVDATQRVRFQGFLLTLGECHMHRTLFDSTVYARVSRRAQERHRFRGGDLVECRATVRVDRGRVLLDRMRAVEIVSRGDGPVWTVASGLVAKRTATTFRRQPEQCLLCPAGTLLDVKQEAGEGVRQFRRLLCLEGVPAPEACAHWLRPRTPEGAE